MDADSEESSQTLIYKEGEAVGAIGEAGWKASDETLRGMLAQAFEGQGVPGMTGGEDENGRQWDTIDWLKPGHPDFVPVLIDWLEGAGYTLDAPEATVQ